ncbi:hypothetical protein Tco_0891365 [Tanacetum coccineum]|uniref:Reverse transcriptase domain-containing protein n=1 Tax=Tanacetum coccineum TaxID=301880 RepID=A0ABQ5C490_9ASTR
MPLMKTTTPMTDAAIKALIAQGVATALAEYEANRGSGNGDDSHDSGSGRRTKRATRECTYSDFLKCQPLNFKGTEGVIGLTQWFEKMAIAYTAGSGERKEYVGTLPMCNRCKLHHNGSCTVKCENCKKNQNHRNQTGGTEACGMVYALGGGETDQDLDDMEDDINA